MARGKVVALRLGRSAGSALPLKAGFVSVAMLAFGLVAATEASASVRIGGKPTNPERATCPGHPEYGACGKRIILAYGRTPYGRMEIIGSSYSSSLSEPWEGVCLTYDLVRVDRERGFGTGCGDPNAIGTLGGHSTWISGGKQWSKGALLRGRARAKVTAVRGRFIGSSGRVRRVEAVTGRVGRKLLPTLKWDRPFTVYGFAFKGCQRSRLRVNSFNRKGKRVDRFEYGVPMSEC